MKYQATADALPADPFVPIMHALPAHVQVSRRVIGVRPLIVLTIGVGLLAVAWWFTTQ